ncbi:MAG: hypothetical protein K6A34_06055 [Methanobrevibacter sp.]|nr:hypothetical protein [Methanobrevibacter sp.]
MEFETNVTSKDDAGNIIGADVNFYDDSGNVVHKVVICEEQQLQDLIDKINALDTAYVRPEQLTNILANTAENTEINATKLNDLNSGSFALREHTHNYCEKNHASSANTFGLGDQSKYGHVKTRNNLTATNFISGEALSAYQGALLSQKVSGIESNQNDLAEKVYKNSLRIKIGRWSDSQGEDGTRIQVNEGSGNGIYAKLYCDKPGYDISNKEVILVINGVPYTRTTDSNGKTGKLAINLNKGTYILTAFRGGYDGVYATSDQKIIQVL